MSSDEAALVRRCLDGQAAAMRQLIERFQNEVFALCVRMLNHRHDAEDVVQEIFIRVFRSLRRWDASRPLKPWIMGITVNRCRTYMSQRAKRPESVDYLHDKPARDDRDDSTELVAELKSAMLELRPEYRAAFVMFHEQNQSYDEIALAMERPVGTIKTWLHRARVEVMEYLRRRGMVPNEAATEVSLKPPLS